MNRLLGDMATKLSTKKLSRPQKNKMWASIEDKLDEMPGIGMSTPRPTRFRTYLGSAASVVAVASVASFVMYGVLHESQRPATTKQVATEPPKNPDAPLALPAASLTYINPPTTWFGVKVVQGTWESYIPISAEDDMPLRRGFQSMLTQPNVKTHSLFESRQTADFPIHAVKGVDEWTRSFTEGVEFPVRNVENGKFVGITWKPIRYYDIYASNKGETVSVTQTLEAESKATLALLSYKPGSKCIGGFGDNLAFLYEDKEDALKELTIYIETSKNQVLKMVVNGSSAEDLTAFAKLYLSAPTQ